MLQASDGPNLIEQFQVVLPPRAGNAGHDPRILTAPELNSNGLDPKMGISVERPKKWAEFSLGYE